MKRYERDYTTLTKEEEEVWHTVIDKEVVDGGEKFFIGDQEVYTAVSRYREYPKAARHFMSIFLNNFLDPVELEGKEGLSKQLQEFKDLLDSRLVSERKILNFIRSKRAYFLVASLLRQYYRFGHHDAYIFPEFQLGNSYKADYLLVGLGSGGWQFVFVELEAPNGKVTLNDGDFGDTFRKGLKQINDWEKWLEANYSFLEETYSKSKKEGVTLPKEFTKLDTSRLHFAVVAGRREDFKESTYQKGRKTIKDNVRVLHYDNVVDAARNIIGSLLY